MSLLRLFLIGWLSVGSSFWLSCSGFANTPRLEKWARFPILKPSRARLVPHKVAMASRSYRKYCRKSRTLREYNFYPNGKSEEQRCT